MGKPVFRVIQNHFAASGNVGAVAAKEEVWEVTAQLAGYALSVALLQQLQDAGGGADEGGEGAVVIRGGLFWGAGGEAIICVSVCRHMGKSCVCLGGGCPVVYSQGHV